MKTRKSVAKSKKKKISRSVRVAYRRRPADSTSHDNYTTELFKKSRNDIIVEIKNGLPYETIKELCTAVEINKSEVAHIVNISLRTLDRRKSGNKFDSAESDRIFRIFEVVKCAQDVFEDTKAAVQWLKTPEIAFGNKTPLEYSDTEIGATEVKDLLGRLQQGVF